MEKVFVVTSGEYSDYSIDAIFSEKEKAEIFIEATNNDRRWNFPIIEEWDLDKINVNKGEKLYFVRMKKDGTVLECYLDSSTYSLVEAGFDTLHNMFSYQFAKDEQHAIKIANERRAKLIIENKF